MESQLELEKERRELSDKLKQALPTVMSAEDTIRDEVYKDGALSTKVKRLMAVGIALKAGCTNCILAWTIRALESGATTEEILETISVVLSMSGTTGIAESLRVIKLLEELGKL